MREMNKNYAEENFYLKEIIRRLKKIASDLLGHKKPALVPVKIPREAPIRNRRR
jgi:hypothetical protein